MNATASRVIGIVILALLLAGGAHVAKAQSAKERMSAHDWYLTGENLHKRGEDAKALEAYDNAFEVAGKSRNWLPVSATLASANILLHQLKYEEAMKTLDRYSVEDLRELGAGWRVRMLRARGMVYVSQGKEPEAIAAFKEALAVEGAQ